MVLLEVADHDLEAEPTARELRQARVGRDHLHGGRGRAVRVATHQVEVQRRQAFEGRSVADLHFDQVVDGLGRRDLSW